MKGMYMTGLAVVMASEVSFYGSEMQILEKARENFRVFLTKVKPKPGVIFPHGAKELYPLLKDHQDSREQITMMN
ncbi:MAG: hypothetical protein WBA22_11890 [Candidatus Methanofastidiosia archaeon]